MIAIRNESEINKIAKSCEIVAETLAVLEKMVEPGVSTLDLDRKAQEMTRKYGVRPAFLNYGSPPYPASICSSLNEEVVHGIPSDKVILKDGDILSIDFGVEKDGYYGDSALTVFVGEISAEKKRLCDVTEESLYAGIKAAREGNRLGDVSAAVQTVVESKGYGVVREFVGHGIGTSLHEDPQIPNFGKKDTGIFLKSGMILAIEPMVSMGKPPIRILEDGWTAVTKDGSPSAHYEHTIVVTKDDARILTLR
jgi:methionyl aminopeptidase